MLAADTNVVTRLLVSDDMAQQRAVHQRLEKVVARGDSVLLSAVVLAELAWVLGSVYDYGRAEMAGALRALDLYETGKAEFPDYFILTLAEAQGAATLLTFDRRLLRHSSCNKP